MAPKALLQAFSVEPIEVDLSAIRQARADRALARKPLEITDFTGKLEDLAEFAVLSLFARRKSNSH
ncbi:MAG: hypothetical protein JNK21_11685 [Rhodospirillaceae bacterium]|nr:hypothetical protein [Rhodospirillaceae bacterium]